MWRKQRNLASCFRWLEEQRQVFDSFAWVLQRAACFCKQVSLGFWLEHFIPCPVKAFRAYVMLCAFCYGCWRAGLVASVLAIGLLRVFYLRAAIAKDVRMERMVRIPTTVFALGREKKRLGGD